MSLHFKSLQIESGSPDRPKFELFGGRLTVNFRNYGGLLKTNSGSFQ